LHQALLEASIAPDQSPAGPAPAPAETLPWSNRIGGVVIVGYLLILLHGFRIVKFLLPRARWVTNLDQRWTDIWMR
jgi:hypothetical protein